MSFVSVPFFVLWISTIILLKIVDILIKNGKRAKHVILLIASYIFYGCWDWRFCFLMFGLTVNTFISIKGILRGKREKIFLKLGIIVPLLILAVFKYLGFFIESFQNFFHIQNFIDIHVILPIGISFYTFQAIGYVIDVYRKDTDVAGFVESALYISFFPQLVAGPIVKAKQFLPQLKVDKKIKLENIATGIQIFIFGLFKKVILADWLSVFVDDVFAAPLAFSSGSIALAIVSYSLQIYFDFSGYSDMAVGCAKSLGYDLPRNFNLPYFSKNVSEFWKRWHISLSEWLMQYLYIPLGGNRKGRVCTYCNLLITMLLGGLWHGSSWHFVLWGGVHGIALCLHKMFLQYNKLHIKAEIPKKAVSCMSVIGTYTFVCVLWVFFRAENLPKAVIIIKRMISIEAGVQQIYFWSIIAILLTLAAYFIAWIKSKNLICINGYYPRFDLEKMTSWIILFVVLGFIVAMAYVGDNPFIYFQF